MGYTTRNKGQITDFWPNDTDNEFYIEEGTDLNSIISMSREKWGVCISFEDIRIRAENIHTECIYYYRYDPSDYTNFLVISKK